MTVRRQSAVILVLAVLLLVAPEAFAVKPQPPPPPPPQLVGIVIATLESNCTGFVAVDTEGRVLVSCFGVGFALAAQLPSKPVSLLAPGYGDNTLHVGLANGDIYRLGDARAPRPWNIIYMGNIFTVAGTGARIPEFPALAPAPSIVVEDDTPEAAGPGVVK